MSTVGKPITCKAAVVWEFNTPFSIETIEVQPPGNGEVRVKIVAAGVCHSDLSQKNGALPHPVPYVAGHEGAGIVESVGEGVSNIYPGDKVFSVFMPQCRQCRVCKLGRGNLCMDVGRKGDVSKGFSVRALGFDNTPKFSCKGKPIFLTMGCSAFSEYTVIPANSCVKVNPKTPLEKACIMACGFSTGYGSSANAVDVRPGDITAVWGMGGVGLAAVLGCKDKGATTIIGIDANPQKEAIARKMGCTDFICIKDLTKPVEQIITEKTNGGVDFAFVCIGNSLAMESAVMSTRPCGSAVLVGVTDATASMTIYPAFLLFGRKIIGTLAGDYKFLDDVPKLVDRYIEGKLPIDDFITGTYKLEQLNEAIEAMKTGQIIRSVILM